MLWISFVFIHTVLLLYIFASQPYRSGLNMTYSAMRAHAMYIIFQFSVTYILYMAEFSE